MAMMRAIKKDVLKYRTRRLMAGDTFETTSERDAIMLRKMGFAEDATVDKPASPVGPRSTVRQDETPAPPSPPPPAAGEQGDDLNAMTRESLLALAEERGVELPSGYVKKDQLVELLGGGGTDGQANDEGGAGR
jgi:hypothetical protein